MRPPVWLKPGTHSLAVCSLSGNGEVSDPNSPFRILWTFIGIVEAKTLGRF